MTLVYILLFSWIALSMLQLVYWSIIKISGFKWFYRNVYLRTWHWRFVRWLKFAQVGRKCQKCNKGQVKFLSRIRSYTTSIIDVHHLTYKHLWWEFLHLNDLQVLCRYHHIQEHNKHSFPEEDVRFI